jgi:hypothetical protein
VKHLVVTQGVLELVHDALAGLFKLDQELVVVIQQHAHFKAIEVALCMQEVFNYFSALTVAHLP